MSGPVRVEEDGTRVYAKGRRYKPKAEHERAYRRLKPDDPRAVRFHGQWFLPLDLVPDEQRVMPETRPDEEAYAHMPRPCQCPVCQRPAAQRWVRKWQVDHGLKPAPVRS